MIAQAARDAEATWAYERAKALGSYGLRTAACLPVFSACYPKYSPPARLGTYGIPEMQTAGSSAIQIAVGAPRYVEPRLTLALNEFLALDANFYVLLNDSKFRDPTFLGSLGVHARWIQRPEHGWRASLVLGPAVGRGGRLAFEDEYWGPPLPKNPVADEFASGGFLGGNLAYRFNRSIEIYSGNRIDLIEAAPNPRTSWQTHAFGLQTRLSPQLFLSTELALLLYRNRFEQEGVIGIGVSVGGNWDK